METLLLLAAEGGHIGPDSPWAKLSVPIGILIFVGPVFLLLRSNLGTRLGYLVMSTSLWGSTFLLALFWTFGAPGTPAFTGPQNLPGQELDAYTPVWVPFAEDAPVVTDVDSPYEFVQNYPAGFGDDAGGLTEEQVANGVSEIANIFSALPEGYTSLLQPSDIAIQTQFATASNGRPTIAVTFAATCQLVVGEETPGCEGMDVGALAPPGSQAREDAGGDQTLFAFFDEGNAGFPSYLMLAGTFFLFALHMVLLARDETRVREETEDAEAVDQEAADDQERTPVPA